ncbi:glycosyltransferase family 2 protein [Alteribacter aurantiacus]|uniref:glycosyltransferase family 2 protein n=1 Tax=Alteribacter aurantiacus TaxID=254410 RepID=UPI000414913B|nr:glycosyltransferase [Alteribacter aurantiacus]
MPLISIIVPVYNVSEDYLRQCIESLVNQTLHDIEIILVDDGTPDNGGIICDQYANKDKRIRVIHQENQGVSAARNHGIEAATGEWITFVDADDWLELNACEILKNNVLQEDSDFLIFALKVNFPDREMINPFWNSDYEYLDKYAREELQIQLLYKTVSQFSPPYNMVGVAVCKLYKKDFLQTFNMKYNTNLSLSEDGVFVFQALENANKIFYINEFLYHYRKHSESATQSFRENAENDYGNGLKELERCLINSGKSGKFYTAFYFRAIFNIFTITNQFYCSSKNRNTYFEKIKGIRMLCNSEPYSSAIKKISVIQYSEKSSFFRSIGFFLLKLRVYSIFYFISLLKNKL